MLSVVSMMILNHILDVLIVKLLQKSCSAHLLQVGKTLWPHPALVLKSTEIMTVPHIRKEVYLPCMLKHGCQNDDPHI